MFGGNYGCKCGLMEYQRVALVGSNQWNQTTRSIRSTKLGDKLPPKEDSFSKNICNWGTKSESTSLMVKVTREQYVPLYTESKISCFCWIQWGKRSQKRRIKELPPQLSPAMVQKPAGLLARGNVACKKLGASRW